MTISREDREYWFGDEWEDYPVASKWRRGDLLCFDWLSPDWNGLDKKGRIALNWDDEQTYKMSEDELKADRPVMLVDYKCRWWDHYPDDAKPTINVAHHFHLLFGDRVRVVVLSVEPFFSAPKIHDQFLVKVNAPL